MKRLHTGLIVFDTIDIICISFSAGSGIAYVVKKYRKYKVKYKVINKVITGEDPIVTELKEKSPVTMFSEDGKPLKLPLVRGGAEKLRGLSL